MFHNNKHCVKMILEYAQLLCSAQRLFLDDEELKNKFYKLTHKNHPQLKWVIESDANYTWLYNLFIALCDEYTLRYSKIHKCDFLFRTLLKTAPEKLPKGDLTLFAITTNEDINDKYKKLIESEKSFERKQELVVEAYREYYMTSKRSFCVWKCRDVPEWFD